MKKILALILALALILTPVLCLAAGGGAPRILSASYDGEYLGGECAVPNGSYWARCTVFLESGNYFVLSIPIYASGQFGVYLAAANVLYIGVEIRNAPGTSPGGTVYDFKPADLI